MVLRIVYVLGNPLCNEDSLPLRLIPKLRKEFPYSQFRDLDIVNEDLDLGDSESNIIDTVKGLSKVELIIDINRIISPKVYSLHDFDLGYTLKLLKKLNIIDRVRLFGIPSEISEKEAFEQLRDLIKSNLL